MTDAVEYVLEASTDGGDGSRRAPNARAHRHLESEALRAQANPLCVWVHEFYDMNRDPGSPRDVASEKHERVAASARSVED